ncbi:MAG: amidohydrolase family protein [Angelakisella sp.]|nr:amidohydrolase family protein [Angelakisella sp.]
MIIDFHMHLFPDTLAQRTIPMLASIANQIPATNGTVSDTLQKMDAWGVDKGVVLHIATKPAQQKNVNDFAASIQGERFYSFGSVHPDAQDALDELARIKSLGLKGVKLHPEYQGFYVDDPKMFPLYDAMIQLNLPVLFHCGWDAASPDVIHAPPHRMAHLLTLFPKLTVIGGHMGGLRMYDEVEEYLLGKNIYLETSMSPRYCLKEGQFSNLLNKHDPQLLLFGTDCPWGEAPQTQAMVESAVLNNTYLDQILYKNALELLK